MIRLTIAGQPEKLRIGTLDIDNRLEERTTASFQVVDSLWSNDFVKGMPVWMGLAQEVTAPESGGEFGLAEFGLAGFGGSYQIYDNLFAGIIDSVQKHVPVKDQKELLEVVDLTDIPSGSDVFGLAEFGEGSFSGPAPQYLDFGSNYIYKTPTPLTFWTIQATDMHYAADKRLAAKAYQNQTVDVIVADLYTDYLLPEGIGIGQIDAGIVLEEAAFNYVPVSQALDALAERVGYWWRIDENKDLYFAQRGTSVAPFDGTGAVMLHDSIRVEHSNPKYRNVQVVRGARDLTSVQTEIQVGDGEKQSFVVAYPIAKVPTVEISIGGGAYTAQTVGIRGIEEGKDWYWSGGDNTISQDSTGTPLTSADMLKVVYQGEFPVIIISRNPGEIIGRQDVEGGGTGQVEEIITENSQSTRKGAFQLAAQLLEKYSTIGRTVTFNTRERGLLPGQLIDITLPAYKLTGQFLIESVQERDEQGAEMRYGVKAIEGPEQKSWANLFKEILISNQPTVRVGVGTGESLILPYQFKKTWTAIETPNIFSELRPTAAGVEPTTTLFPSFDPGERVTHVEMMSGVTTVFRKAITTSTEVGTTLATIAYISPGEGNGTIDSIRWYGGIDAGTGAGSGVAVDEQSTSLSQGASPWVKTSSESWQIESENTRW